VRVLVGRVVGDGDRDGEMEERGLYLGDFWTAVIE
jgi:hypothetical protein